MIHRPLLGLTAFIAVWFVLSGGGGCSTQPSTCPGPGPQTASSGDDDYTLGDGEGLVATDVTWSPAYEDGANAVTVGGSGEACMLNGGIFGPIPNNAVYECLPQHCPGGTCPTPCLAYHTKAGIEHARTTDTLYHGQCIRREGDGISSTATAGGLMVKGSYFALNHDDAIEHDHCKNIVVQDVLMESVFMATAAKLRVADEGTIDCTGSVIDIRASIVKLNEFPNQHELKTGHGGLYKTTVGNSPKRVLKGNHIIVGPVVGDGQEVIPPPSLFVNENDCTNNVYYFRGTEAAYAAFLADSDGRDAMTNGERLTQLGESCIEVIAKPDSQSDGDFLLEYVSPIISAWKYNHAADEGC